MVSLKPDILHLIFEYLHNPLPPRHAPAKARPSRSSIRQNDLCALLRVNKEFYNLVTPILYGKFVATDKFPLLVVRHDKRIPGVISKTELLSSVRSLYLEYSEKEESPEWRYQDLFDVKSWDLLEGGEAQRSQRRDWHGVREGKHLAWAWQSMMETDGRQKKIFTSLRTLATGAIFGQQEEIWRSIGGRFNNWTQEIFTSQQLILYFILGNPSIRHYCQSGSVGPLNVGTTYITDRLQNKATIATHSDYHDPTLLPICIGVRSRFYLHAKPTDPGYNEALHIRWARQNIEDAVHNRQNFAEDQAYARTVPSWGIVGGVYRNYPQKAGAGAYRRTIGPVLEKANARLPRWVKAADDWETKPLEEAPACDGCGWKPGKA